MIISLGLINLGLKEQLENEIQNLPNREAISPSKFDDKFILEDKMRSLNSIIHKQFKKQNDLFVPVSAETIEIPLELSNHNIPTEIVELHNEIENINNQINITASQCQLLNRHKMILDQKYSLSTQKSKDIKCISQINNRVEDMNQANGMERDSIGNQIQAKNNQIFEQELHIKELQKVIKEMKKRLLRLENREEDDNFEEEYNRLREILDIMNRRLEKLKISVNRDDENAHVRKKILEDKSNYIIQLQRQLKDIEQQEGSQDNLVGKSRARKLSQHSSVAI